jgi:hypothetical protein
MEGVWNFEVEPRDLQIIMNDSGRIPGPVYGLNLVSCPSTYKTIAPSPSMIKVVAQVKEDRMFG